MVDRGNFTMMRNSLDFVDERVLAVAAPEGRMELPAGFQPTNWTVLCGRGKECFNHYGNRRFRVLCEINLERYEAARTKMEKTLIVAGIVDAVRHGSGGLGAFVKEDPKSGLYVDIGDKSAREKVGQQLRELLIQKDPTKLHGRREKRKVIDQRAGRRRSAAAKAAKRGSHSEDSPAKRPSLVNSASLSMDSSPDSFRNEPNSHQSYIFRNELTANIGSSRFRLEQSKGRASFYSEVSIDSAKSPVGAIDGDNYFQLEQQHQSGARLDEMILDNRFVIDPTSLIATSEVWAA